MRKPHKKSRLGCQTCKRRKVKCDESKPECNTCVRFGVSCDYSRDALSKRRSTSLPPTTTSRKGRPRNDWASWAEQLRLSSASTSSSPSPNGSLNVDDIELFHNYMTSTAATLEDENRFWSEGIPRLGFQHPGVLSLVLALSSYHLIKTRPFDAPRFFTLAERHMTVALPSATTLVQSLDPENGPALYVTAMLVCFTAFAKGPYPGNMLLVADHDQVPWLSLLRGVRLVVTKIGWPCIFSGALAPYFPGKGDEKNNSKDAKTMNPASTELLPGEIEDWRSSLSKISILIDGHEEQEVRDAYAHDYEGLLRCYESTFTTRSHAKLDVEGKMQVIFSWIYQLDDPFVDGLGQNDPIALLMLAHFCVLLQTLSRYWFLEGWASHILGEILRSSPACREGSSWPMKYVKERKGPTPTSGRVEYVAPSTHET